MEKRFEDFLKNGGKLVCVMRHGDKDSDKLTAKGAAQVFAAAEQIGEGLKETGVDTINIVYSGMNRTRQTAMIALAAMGMKTESDINAHEGFAFMEIFNANYPKMQDFVDEWDRLKDNHAGKPTVADALKAIEFVAKCRDHISAGILDVAATSASSVVFAASHSPFTELATCDPEKTPYGLDEASVMAYCVKNGEIVHSDLIKCPKID